MVLEFNVLDRKTNPLKNAFLEASAGTGKTFAIVTLVLRLLLSDKGILLPEILIVTFTKLATLELKKRLREALETAIHLLEKGQNLPDYLQEIYENGEGALTIAKKRLERALSNFDDAKVFTIHSFCHKSLEEHAIDTHFNSEVNENEAHVELSKEIVRDYLRFHHTLHPRQMERLLKDLEVLVDEILFVTEKRVAIEPPRAFDAIFKEYQEVVRHVLQKYRVEKEALIADLLLYAPHFKNMSNRKRELKDEVRLAIVKTAETLMAGDVFPFDSILLEMQNSNLLQKAILPEGHYPGLLQEIITKIVPLIEEAQDELKMVAELSRGALHYMQSVLQKEEVYFFEDILLLMEKSVRENGAFAEKIQKSYSAVFVDEFQDTDTTQWSIISHLFLDKKYKGFLYLIGDPKQSIYRFRKADLYTYFAAKTKFSEDEIHTLGVNYRSEESLISNLNALFTPVKEFLVLPKNKQSFPVLPVKAPVKTTQVEGPTLYFCIANNEEELFRYIANECKRLPKERVKAVLVKDRFQEKRFLEICLEMGVEAVAKRSRPLNQSPAFFALQELLTAVLNPKDRNAVAIAQLGPIISGSPLCFLSLHETLMERGILPLFKELEMFLLQAPFGIEFYSDLLQLVEYLATHCNMPSSYLVTLEKLQKQEREDLKGRFCGQESAVQVLTIHASKGLEYDVVFPVGLIASQVEHKKLVYDSERNMLTYAQSAFERHLEELEAEKLRLLYVAMTRAKNRLYLPVIEKAKKALSPMHLFMEKMLQGESLEAFIAKHPSMKLVRCEDVQNVEVVLEERKEELVMPAPVKLVLNQNLFTSFSMIKEEREHSVTKSDSSLPSGSEFGNFVHLLLEKMPFQEALCSKFFEKSPFLPWKDQILEMIHAAFHTPLPLTKPFKLAGVDPRKCIKEMEFLYKEENGNFMKGFIDLIFEHEGTIYLVDWKTNDLGGDYSQEAIVKAMEENQYFLQRQIYVEAVRRCVGNQKIVAIYFFLRGGGINVCEF